MEHIKLLEQHVKADNKAILTRFVSHIKHLYQYEIFKPILDLSLTKAKEELLKFSIKEQHKFDLDEGNCKTIEQTSWHSFINNFQRKKSYVITIKKIAYDVIMHETAHMIEKELNLDLNIFVDGLKKDLQNLSSLVSLESYIEEILIKQVRKYHKNQHHSELFARYFQLLATAKEVSGHQQQTAFHIADIYKALPNTHMYVTNELALLLQTSIDPHISKLSAASLKKITNIKHNWSEQRVASIHKTKVNVKPKWRQTIKSIKDI